MYIKNINVIDFDVLKLLAESGVRAMAKDILGDFCLKKIQDIDILEFILSGSPNPNLLISSECLHNHLDEALTLDVEIM